MRDIWPVISVSLIVAFFATAIVMVLAIVLAIFFVKSRTKLAQAIELLLYLPMALPPVAVGYGLLLALGRNSVMGQSFYKIFGAHISFTMLGAIIAACSVSLGIGIRYLRVAFESIDRQQGQIARMLGATKFEILWHIYLPQCRASMLGAAALVFIRALSEFGATMVFAGNALGETRTLALAIWIGMEAPGHERECFLLVLIALFISLIALLAAEFLLRRNARQ